MSRSRHGIPSLLLRAEGEPYIVSGQPTPQPESLCDTHSPLLWWLRHRKAETPGAPSLRDIDRIATSNIDTRDPQRRRRISGPEARMPQLDKMLAMAGMLAVPGARAIAVAPNSPCSSQCGNDLSQTSAADLVCQQGNYGDSTGVVFEACINCELTSGYSTGNNDSDTKWVLCTSTGSNIRLRPVNLDREG